MLASQRLARPQCRPSIVLPPSPAALAHAPRQQPASVVRCCASTVGCTSLQLTTCPQGRPSHCPTTNGELHRRRHTIQPGSSRQQQQQHWQQHQQQQQPINGGRAIVSCFSPSRRMVRMHASGPSGIDGPSDEEDDGFPAEDEEDDSLDPLAAGFGEEDDDDVAAAVDDPFMKRLLKASGKGGKRGSISGGEELDDDLDVAELEDLDDEALAEVAAAAAAAAEADEVGADGQPGAGADSPAGGGGDGDDGEEEPDFPERPQRCMLMSQLFRDVGMESEALVLEQEFADAVVAGIQSDPAKVLPGDLYVEHDLMYPSYSRWELAAWAIHNGCSGIVIMEPPEDEDWAPEVPENCPIITVPNPVDTGQLLAVAFYGAPSRDMFMVNITGSHGKTTVAWLVRGILEQQGQVTGMVGSIEHALAEYRLDNDGDIWQPTEEDPTADRESSAPFRITPYQGKYVVERNPPGMHLQKLLAGMRDRGAKWCITEASTPALELGFYDLCETNVAVFTNLGDTDLAFHEGHEGLEEAVYKLFEGLEDSLTQAAVINIDDEYGRELQKLLSGTVPMTTFGIDSREADVYAENVDLNTWESEMIIRTPKGRLQIITSLLGRHNVYNVVAAVAVGISLNVPLKSIVAGIEAVEVIPGRCEVIDEGQNFSVIVDAGRTPEAVAAMLDATKAGKSNRTFCVVGASAGSGKEQRRELGKVVHERAEYVILTNENPGNEDAGAIISDIVSGFPDEIVNRYNYYAYFPFQDQTRAPLWFEPYLQSAQRAVRRYIFEDRFSAIRAAIGTASEGDVVLILGKGDEDFIEYPDGEGGVTRGWFDDRVECRAALSKLKYLYQLKGTDRRTLPWSNGKVKEPDEADVRIMGRVTSATTADAVAWVKKETRRPVGAGVGAGGDDDGSGSDDAAEFDE